MPPAQQNQGWVTQTPAAGDRSVVSWSNRQAGQLKRTASACAAQVPPPQHLWPLSTSDTLQAHREAQAYAQPPHPSPAVGLRGTCRHRRCVLVSTQRPALSCWCRSAAAWQLPVPPCAATGVMQQLWPGHETAAKHLLSFRQVAQKLEAPTQKPATHVDKVAPHCTPKSSTPAAQPQGVDDPPVPAPTPATCRASTLPCHTWCQP